MIDYQNVLGALHINKKSILGSIVNIRVFCHSEAFFGPTAQDSMGKCRGNILIDENKCADSVNRQIQKTDQGHLLFQLFWHTGLNG